MSDKILNFDAAVGGALQSLSVARCEPEPLPPNAFALAYQAELERQAQVAVAQLRQERDEALEQTDIWVARLDFVAARRKDAEAQLADAVRLLRAIVANEEGVVPEDGDVWHKVRAFLQGHP